MIEAEYKRAVQAAKKAWLEEQVFRGDDFKLTFNFAEADYSAATFAAQIRQTPDADGDPVAAFTVGTAVFADGDTSVAFSLPDDLTLPAAAEQGRTAKLYMDFKITFGGVTERFAAGSLTIIGKVTP